MTSSLFKHAFVVAGILFFVLLFLIPAAHYRCPSVHGRHCSTSGLMAVLHSIRSFIRSKTFAGSANAALLMDLNSLSPLYLSIDSVNSESGLALPSPIRRC
jgi:hypothetical protein